MGLHEIKKLLHNKRNVSKLKKSPTELLVIHQTKVLITRIYKELKKLSTSKINGPIKKWANELIRTFSKEEVQMGKKYLKKCSPSHGHKGNASQNHTKIPPHSC
jgi:hypothetical protein